MKRETILKIFLALTIGILLFAMPAKVFADPLDSDFFEDQGGLDNIGGEKIPTPEIPEEKLPEAGLAEDTVMIISIFALIAIATFAYKKVNEYSNI